MDTKIQENLEKLINEFRDHKREVCYSQRPSLNETNHQQSIEHYRPKKKYYWLAFSWDNLLLVCSKCNNSKGEKFPIQGTMRSYQNTDMLRINELCYEYNEIEKPDVIHPVFEKVDDKIEFKNDGKMYSNDQSVNITKDLFDLNRKYLTSIREEIINTLLTKISLGYLEGNYEEILRKEVQFLIEQSEDNKSIYLLFKRYLLSNFNTMILTKIIP